MPQQGFVQVLGPGMFQEDQVWWLCRQGTLTLGDIPTGCYLITAMSQVSDESERDRWSPP